MKHTVKGWRAIGHAYEKVAFGDDSVLGLGKIPNVKSGLCSAAASMGFPSYDERGSVPLLDSWHGNTYRNFHYNASLFYWRRNAAHRAMSAYLIAEMLQTGDLPLCR